MEEKKEHKIEDDSPSPHWSMNQGYARASVPLRRSNQSDANMLGQRSRVGSVYSKGHPPINQFSSNALVNMQ